MIKLLGRHVFGVQGEPLEQEWELSIGVEG